MNLAAVTLPRALQPVEAGELTRLGAARDGGYVLPRSCIREAGALVCFGLSANWEFEKAFRREREALGKDLVIHAYDHTVNARALRLYRLKSLVHLVRTRRRDFWLAARMAGGYRRFFDGRRATHFEEKVAREDGPSRASVRTVMERLEPARRAFLSMDIEGDEFRVADQLAPFADRFVGMGVEFHGLDLLWDPFLGIHATFSARFAVAHVHVNNVTGLGPGGRPNTLEITYVHRSLLPEPPEPVTRAYPIEGLDSPNAADLPDFRVLFA